MKAKINHFEIDFNLHHPNLGPQVISEALSVEPWFSVKSGEQIGTLKHQRSSWLCKFREGALDSEFSNALDEVASLLSRTDVFVRDFVETGGEIELVVNAAVQLSGDKVFELSLHPWFLQEIGKRDVGLKVCAWSTEDQRTDRPANATDLHPSGR